MAVLAGTFSYIWHFFNTSSMCRLSCCWLEPLTELATDGALGCNPFSHASQLFGGFSYLGCLKCIFKPTIKLSKFCPQPNLGSHRINNTCFCKAPTSWIKLAAKPFSRRTSHILL